MGEKNTDRSFAGGEISPDMYGRVDLAKYQTGLALCRNAFVLPHGPVENRPGTEFVANVKNAGSPVRLIPFVFSFTQTLALEIGAGYCRFHTQAGNLLAGSAPAWTTLSSNVALPTVPTSVVTFAITYAAFAVTWAAHGLVANTPVSFTTTGTLPWPIVAGAVYYVVGTSITTNSFQLSTSINGLAMPGIGITATGVQTAVATIPAVVTWAAHGLVSGASVQLSTTGALPTGISAGATYYIINPTTNTFQLAASLGGNPITITGTQSGTPSAASVYPPGALVTYSGTTYYCINATASVAPPNTTYWYALPASGVYEIPNNYAQADLMNLHFVQSDDVLTIVHPNYPIAELRRYAASTWVLAQPSFSIPNYYPSSVTAAVTSPHTTSWNPFTAYYCVTTIQQGDLQESSASNSTAGMSNDLTIVGNVNTITWVPPAASSVAIARYNVYKNINGLWGFIGQAGAGATTFVDNNIFPNTALTPPLVDAGFNDAPGNYPGAVCYYQQRRWFGGTNNLPQSVWATMSGTESNMSYTLPVQFANRLALKIAAREASGVQHIVPVANLVMLTPSTEWRITSTDGSAVWAGNVSVQPQSYVGSNNITPVVVGNSILFSQSRGSRIREMTFNWQSQAYLTNDISVMAGHLFDYKQIVDMAFSKAPYPILHCVTSDGNLASLTYVPEQQVAAWHHHDFGGVVETICTITEQPAGTVAPEDMLYMVVRRISPTTGFPVRTVERLHTRYFTTPSDAWFVDSGATNAQVGTYSWQSFNLYLNIPSHGVIAGQSMYFTFSDTNLSGYYNVTSVVDANNITILQPYPSNSVGTVNMTATYQVTTVSGLTWLAGMTVNILADGAPVPAQVVSNTGTITLPYPVTKVIVGLPITCQVEPLPIAFQTDGGFGESLEKNVNQVWLRVYRTSGMYVGPDFNNLTYVTQRAATDLPGNAPALFSGVIPVQLQPEWGIDASVCIQQTDPLPMTLCAIASDTTLR